jgi:DNA-binding transcriptional MocR family regulator
MRRAPIAYVPRKSASCSRCWTGRASFPSPAVFPTPPRSPGCRRAKPYSVSEGYAPLRRRILGHMQRLGIACGEDYVVISSGSQQGLEFLGKLLLSRGDTALTAAPTYRGALQAFAAYEPRYDALLTAPGNRTPRSKPMRRAPRADA